MVSISFTFSWGPRKAMASEEERSVKTRFGGRRDPKGKGWIRILGRKWSPIVYLCVLYLKCYFSKKNNCYFWHSSVKPALSFDWLLLNLMLNFLHFLGRQVGKHIFPRLTLVNFYKLWIKTVFPRVMSIIYFQCWKRKGDIYLLHDISK